MFITREANGIRKATTIQVVDGRPFADVYERYSPALYNALYKVLKNAPQAEIALQNTFTKICRHQHSYDAAKSSLFTWMLNVARNEALYALCSRPCLQASVTFTIDVQELTGCRNPFVHLDHISISKLLFLLNTKDRNISELCFFRGFTCGEAAEILQIPYDTVKTRIQYSYRRLCMLLIDSNGDEALLPKMNSA